MDRECRLLVLSPRARSKSHVQQYKPFQAKFLAEILEEAAQNAKMQTERDYDRHSIFEGLFFGAKQLEQALRTELKKHVPTCIVDCSTFRGENEEAKTARDALHFLTLGHDEKAKLLVLLCNDKCAVDTGYQMIPASSDGILIGYLGFDLCDNRFKRVGAAMGKRT